MRRSPRLEDAPRGAVPALVVAYLLKALAMHGYRPEFESCVVCAGELEEGTGFSLIQGGSLCPACGAIDSSALKCPDEARAWLHRLLGATMAEIAELEMPAEAVSDCFDLVRAFVVYHVPARLKALDFYAAW